MQRHRSGRLQFIVLAWALACVSGAGAQRAPTRDSVRVLRFQPDSAASPVAPVVITFDRPVAPKLDESIAPESLLAITPAAPHRTYWRDPSTLVAEFDAIWAPGSSYAVRLAPGTRSADGLPFALRAPWRVRVQMPRLIDVLPIGAAYEETYDMPRVADPSANVNLIFSSPVTTPALAGRLWFVPADPCSNRDSVRLAVRSIRRIETRDSHLIKEAGGYDRDRRLDTLRRVVEVRAERPPPRGCIGIVRTPTFGAPRGADRGLRIAPVFSLTSFETYTAQEEHRDCTGSQCEAGLFIPRFSQPVTGEELREHLRIDGRAPRLAEEAWSGITARINDTLHAGRRLRVSIDRSLTSRYGERLGAAIDTVLAGWQLTPAVGLANGQVILSKGAPDLIRVRYANTDSVRVIVARVADTARSRALAYTGREDEGTSWSRVASDSVVHVLEARADSAHEGVIRVPPQWVPARWGSDPLLAIRAMPLKNTPRAPRGAGANVLPTVTVIGDVGREPRFAIAQRSDLAAHAGRHGDAVVVWVTRRATGEPVRAARVVAYVRGVERLADATTDELGIARLTGVGIRTARDVAPDRHLEIVADGDRVLLSMPRAYERDDRSVPDDSTSASPEVMAARGTLHGAAFADRGIYRPGQRVYVKGAARAYRTETGYRLPSADSARWTLSFERDGSSEPIVRRTGRLGDFGSYSDSLELPATARVGWYRAPLEVHDRWGWRDAATASFAIAEYRIPEFAVRATADTSAPVYAGDSATIRVEANYLFGPPMANALVNATVYTADQWSTTPRLRALEGFEVGRSTWLDEERAQEQDAQPAPAHLGSDGTLVMRVPSRRITRPGILSVTVNVQDANRQSIAASTSVPLRVADAFVGLRTQPRRWDWNLGTAIPLELIVVNGDGAVRPGTLVSLAAERITWAGGRWKRDTTWRDSVASGEGIVRSSFAPTKSGWYEIVATIRDDRGRVAQSATHLAVMGAGWAGRQGGLFLSLERSDVQPGDTAVATIEAPAELHAWASLRTQETSWQQLVTLKRGLNVLRVPIPATSTQNAQLQIVAVRGVTATVASAEVPYFFQANTWLSVSDSARTLRVRVAADRGRYQPRDTVLVNVDVEDRHGRGQRSELAVWAVDEGVVSLTGYRPPTLLAQLLNAGYEHWFFGSTLLGTLMPGPPGLGPVYSRYGFSRRDVTGAAASLSLLQLRGDTYSADALTERAGRNEGSPAVPALRHRFVTTPFFAGHVVTDADGHATTSFVLPDNVTTYRLFAVAIDDEVRAGSGDTTIVTTRPLVVRAALPRAVRRGDSLFAGAVLTREGAGADTPVTLTVTAGGMRIDGPATAHDTLVGTTARERRFPMSVHADDSVTVGFSATSPSDGDAVMMRLPVSTPGRPRAHVAMGTLRSEEIVVLALPDDLDPRRSRLVLRSGQSPLPLLRELDERLRVYPYACTEQVASAARALIARVRLERTIGYRATLAPADRKRLELAVNALLDRQRQDGGFGYWSPTHWTTPWLTSHALDALLGARDLGVAVPQAALDRSIRYLGADPVIGDYMRQQWLPPADSAHWAREALHAARLLRKLQRPDTTLERRLWALRANLDFEDRLTLARLRAAGGDSAGARALVDQAWRSVRVEGRRVVVEDSVLRRRWLFRSVTGTYTGLLRATAALRPAHPQLAPLLESVLQSAHSDAVARWNTVDQTMLAETIEAVAAPLGLNATARVAVTDLRGTTSALELPPAGADSLPLPLERFVVEENGRRSLRVKLASASDTPTYYALTLHEVPVTRPVRPDQEGIAVERWYERYEDGTPITEVSEGELVRVRLRITAPRDREFVVIDDPLPAGLEAVDQSLRTTGSLPPYAGAPKVEGDAREGPVGQKWLYGSWDGGWWTPWEHKEIRDDRVLWFARQLWRGSYQASYVARATTAGLFVRPPAQAEEMYNPAVRGRSEGGLFSIRSKDPVAPNR